MIKKNEQKLVYVPTLPERPEQRERLVDQSIVGKLAEISNQIEERLKAGDKTAEPLLQRLLEVDALSAVEIISDNQQLLKLLNNERVILKYYADVKDFISQAEQIIADHKIPASDPRAEAVKNLKQALDNLTAYKTNLQKFEDEHPDLSVGDKKLVAQLNEIAKTLIKDHKIEAEPPVKETLEQETARYLRMYLKKQQSEKTPMDPEFQLKNLNKLWERQLMGKNLEILYPNKKNKMEKDYILIDDQELFKVIGNTQELIDKIIVQFNSDDDKNYILQRMAVAAYDIGDPGWKEILKQIPVQQQQNALHNITINAYKKGDQNYQQILLQITDHQMKIIVMTTLGALAYQKGDLNTQPPKGGGLEGKTESLLKIKVVKSALRAQ